MRGKIFLAVSVFFAGLAVASLVFAKPPAAVRARHADRNKDGVVGRKEVRMEKRWKHKQQMKAVDKNADSIIDAKEKRLSWRHSKAKVNKPIEAKYDANGDGWLQPEEVKQMLKARHELIKTHGKAKVDTDVEKAYDANNDGIIDAEEAAAMAEDVQQ